jgi:hypothetical protein
MQPTERPAELAPTLRLPLALAVALTILNAFKPLHVDDATYYQFARQMAAHPLDPYGFQLMYWDRMLPANWVLAPPVLPYWWAIAIRLFGQHPVLWKLWLLPFCFAFTWSLDTLLCRFARAARTSILCVTVLSPVFLPSLNLMIDVPATALGLLGLALFVGAVDQDRPLRAIMAGMVAGLAMQTKYTACITPAVMLAYAGLYRKYGIWLLAAMAAVAVFAGWEMFVAWRYGESHFVHHLRAQERSFGTKAQLAFRLFTVLGGVAPALAVLGLTALGLPVRGLLCLGGLVGAWFVVLAVGDDALVSRLACGYTLNTVIVGRGTVEAERATVTDLVFGAVGVLVLSCYLAAGGAQVITARRAKPSYGDPGNPRDAWFVVVWFMLEIIGYFAVSPYAAVRRVMGIMVAASVLVARLLARQRPGLWRERLVYGVSAAGVALGLLFYWVDLVEAEGQKEAVRLGVAQIRRTTPTATIWHNGYWGFEFYAEQAGARRIIPAYARNGVGLPAPEPSKLRQGDWILVPDPRIPQESILWGEAVAYPVTISDRTPLATVGGYYSGGTPLKHHQGPRVAANVACLLADTVAQCVSSPASSGDATVQPP